jgi:membrane protease YdiL (CAAX protease family)
MAPETSHSTSAPRPSGRYVFFGPRRLRAGWRVLIFSATVTAFAVLFALTFQLLKFHGVGGWSPGRFLATEAMSLIIALAATALVARIDRLPFAVFGITWRDAFRGHFWEGSLWGLVAVGALVGMIALGGGYRAHGLALHGAELARMTALWLAVMTLVGLSEEFLFRGYFLSALTDGVGFWSAAALTSLDFALTHYFGKPMENLTDALSVGLIGLFLCFTLRRTGTLWFAIGFHFAFDFAALVLFGAPNTGNGGRPIEGHLLDGTFAGPDWLTGGVRGVEASALVFIVIAALFALFHLRHRDMKFPIAHD